MMAPPTRRNPSVTIDTGVVKLQTMIHIRAEG